MWIQAPAFRIVNAFQKRGVHADSLSPCLISAAHAIHLGKVAYLLGRDSEEVSLRSRFRDRRLGKGKDKDVLWQDPLFLHTRRGEVDVVAGLSAVTKRVQDSSDSLSSDTDSSAGTRNPSEL